MAGFSEVLDDNVGFGGGDKGLVGSEVVGQGVAAFAVELGKNVVEQEQGGCLAGGLDDFELDDFQSQDGSARFTARGRFLGWPTIKRHQ